VVGARPRSRSGPQDAVFSSRRAHSRVSSALLDESLHHLLVDLICHFGIPLAPRVAIAASSVGSARTCGGHRGRCSILHGPWARRSWRYVKGAERAAREDAVISSLAAEGLMSSPDRARGVADAAIGFRPVGRIVEPHTSTAPPLFSGQWRLLVRRCFRPLEAKAHEPGSDFPRWGRACEIAARLRMPLRRLS
jgi:hypothetical protein